MNFFLTPRAAVGASQSLSHTPHTCAAAPCLPIRNHRCPFGLELPPPPPPPSRRLRPAPPQPTPGLLPRPPLPPSAALPLVHCPPGHGCCHPFPASPRPCLARLSLPRTPPTSTAFAGSTQPPPDVADCCP
jgi:hypothetical protein